MLYCDYVSHFNSPLNLWDVSIIPQLLGYINQNCYAICFKCGKLIIDRYIQVQYIMSIGANNPFTNISKGAINYKNNLINGAGYNNYGYNSEQKLLTIPFYFFPFLAQDLAEGNQIL